MRRVVVTGLGVISPIGNEIDTFWKNVKDGVCGIDKVTRFDASAFACQVAGEVKDFEPTQYIDRKEAKRMTATRTLRLRRQKWRLLTAGSIWKKRI